MRNEVSVIYVSTSQNSDYNTLEKLYDKFSTEAKDMKWEFVLSSPSEDFVNLSSNINFASNKNNVICVKAKENSIYSALRAATHVTNYKVSVLIQNLTEETVKQLNIDEMLKETNTFSDFSMQDNAIGIGMKTFYMRTLVHEIKFSDENMNNEISYACGRKEPMVRKERKVYKKYFKMGTTLKRLYGVE